MSNEGKHFNVTRITARGNYTSIIVKHMYRSRQQRNRLKLTSTHGRKKCFINSIQYSMC